VAQKNTILIVDDHALFREGLRAIIERNPRYEVVGEAGNGREGLRMAGKLKPDLALMAEGFSTNEISKKLFISSKTVENHRSSIMRKLDLHSIIEIVRYAAKIGLIDIDLWKE